MTTPSDFTTKPRAVGAFVYVRTLSTRIGFHSTMRPFY